MKTFALVFTGRKRGAIGVFYQLPAVEVKAETLPEAKDTARDVLALEYEHIHFSYCVSER